MTYDSVGRLDARRSHAVTLRTSEFRAASRYRSEPIDCEVSSVSFTDGSSWAVAPGVALPYIDAPPTTNP
jgi:hypothetical protein